VPFLLGINRFLIAWFGRLKKEKSGTAAVFGLLIIFINRLDFFARFLDPAS
jgi:hypothetical protein